MKKIPLYMVTGFLGSGKTTLLKNLLSKYSEEKKILLVQNEFASSGIDAEVLNSTSFHFSLLECNRGSVFCVCLFGNFTEQLHDAIVTQKPDMIVLETTGVADPIAVAQLLEDGKLRDKIFLSHIWSVVDVTRYDAVRNIQAVQHQIEIADSILLNKCDLFRSKELDTITTDVKKINPFANILEVEYCRIDFKKIIDAQFAPLAVVLAQNKKGMLTKCGNDRYKTQIFKSADPIDKTKFQEFLNTLTEETYRLKGFVQFTDGMTVMVQYVPSMIEMIEIKNRFRPTELIAIGTKDLFLEKNLL